MTGPRTKPVNAVAIIFLLPILFLSAAIAQETQDDPRTAAATPGAPQLPAPANPSLPTLFLIGDSTVRNGRGDGANGQWGWGEPLTEYFDPAKINVVNRALGGRSSRTYLTQGYWDAVRAMLKRGDFVMMQFGHNDSGPLDDAARARGTLAGVGDETREIDNPVTKQRELVHTYGWYLAKFVAETRAAGATPIICSPIPRKVWTDGKIVRNSQDYGGWSAAVAVSHKVLFIDLNEIIARRYETLGPEKVEALFRDERTHTGRAGAELNAECVIAGLKGLEHDPLAIFLSPFATPEDVQLTLNGKRVNPGDYKPADVAALTMQDGLLEITFGSDGSATSLKKNGRELVHNLNGIAPRDPNRYRTWYVDYDGSRGSLVADTIRVLQNTPEMAHIAIIDSGVNTAFYVEHHVLMRRGESGLYGYVICRNIKNIKLGGEMRTMYRLDRDIFDWAYFSERAGQQPRYSDLVKLPSVQDETWKMPDGTIYQKYDYAGYFAENPFWGHYGHDYGIWFIPASTEYYAAGPLRQDLIVHQDALILNYLQGSHFGGGGPGAFKNNEKLVGPWFTYVNTGSAEAVIADAKRKAAIEDARWPYVWMNEPLYPLNRTSVTGQLKVADGRSAANAMVVLGQPGVEIYKQAGDFIFYARANSTGKFTIPNVRPGTYALYAYATQGTITSQLEMDNITVSGSSALELGTVLWSPPNYATLLWQIGKSDRMSGEFKYGDQLRNIKWIGMVPSDLTFAIGKSNEREDWYFAQGKTGNWDINFNLDRTYSGIAHLTVAIAGVSNNPQLKISVNGQEVRSLSYGNDAATYRSALRSARYQLEDIQFPAALLRIGSNVVRLGMTAVGSNGGIMYDTLKLEVDASAAGTSQ